MHPFAKLVTGIAVAYATIGAVIAVVVYTGVGKLPDIPDDDLSVIDWDEIDRWLDTRAPGPL